MKAIVSFKPTEGEVAPHVVLRAALVDVVCHCICCAHRHDAHREVLGRIVGPLQQSRDHLHKNKQTWNDTKLKLKLKTQKKYQVLPVACSIKTNVY